MKNSGSRFFMAGIRENRDYFVSGLDICYDFYKPGV
jgi:hypothetical protein